MTALRSSFQRSGGPVMIGQGDKIPCPPASRRLPQGNVPKVFLAAALLKKQKPAAFQAAGFSIIRRTAYP